MFPTSLLRSLPLAIACLGIIGCGRGAPADANGDASARKTVSSTVKTGQELADLRREIEPQIEKFCAYCHPAPSPGAAPREDWRHEIELAYGFHRESPLAHIAPPDIEKVVAYYESLAPRASEIEVPLRRDAGPGELRFTKQPIKIGDSSLALNIAGLKFLASGAGSASLLACDMQSGQIRRLAAEGDSDVAAPGASPAVTNPCHVEACDLDGDGKQELVVADLGAYLPMDDPVGRVVWLRPRETAAGYEPIVLADKLGRVADVQPGDFDGDGDQDLVVAEFGWQKLGQVLLLINQGGEGPAPRFEQRQVDNRHGAIHVPVADLNGDGKLDFMALLSQEHETIIAYLNRGDGTFDKNIVYAAPHPLYGSSSIQLVDMDGDADLDVLYANGDGFDRRFLKPFHAVQWLENTGKYPFVHRHLTYMPGCHRALGGDLDGDGDLDVLCASFLRTTVRNQYGPARFDGIVWLEQTSRGTFVRHGLQNAACDHAALEMADFDADGDLDFAVGAFVVDAGGSGSLPPSVTVWWNDRIPSDRRFGGASSAAKQGDSRPSGASNSAGVGGERPAFLDSGLGVN